MTTKNTKITPLADRVVIKPIDNNDTKTASGIIIPDTVSKDKPEQGVVVAVGDGKITESGKVIPVNVKVGDMVIFSKFGPDEVVIGGEEYIILSEASILAVIK